MGEIFGGGHLVLFHLYGGSCLYYYPNRSLTVIANVIVMILHNQYGSSSLSDWAKL